MARIVQWAVACSAFAALTACGGGDSAATPTQRTTSLGEVVGSDDTASSGTYSWKGIPYAKPPVGELRWKAPADADPWKGQRSARQFANACASSSRIYGPGLHNTYDATIGTSFNSTVGSEDCLYLNVWRPAGKDEKLPVIVWVHGGSNITGYTADPVYDGANLARTANAVVVSVNYRLGVLGFLNSQYLKTGNAADDSGNFAMLDLIKALQFINRNIANFGGDAGNVTLMGQSAGAVNVWALATAPAVVNANPAWVHRLVPLSGGVSMAADKPAALAASADNWMVPALEPMSDWSTRADALLTNLLMADGTATDASAASAYIAQHTKAQLADYLRSKSADQILDTVVTKLRPAGQGGANPLPDGTVIPANPIAEIKAGRWLKVPVLVGTTRDEIKLFPSAFTWVGLASGRMPAMTDPQAFALAYSYDPNAAPATTLQDWIPAANLPTTAAYPGFDAVAGYINQHYFVAIRDAAVEAVLTQPGQKVWSYRFDWDKQPAPFNEIFGAAHAFDLPFIFGNFGPSLWSNVNNSNANKAGRLALSDAMMKSIGAFARDGDPNNAALGMTWPMWPKHMVFDATLTDKALSVQ